jgi:hypothetical protein
MSDGEKDVQWMGSRALRLGALRCTGAEGVFRIDDACVEVREVNARKLGGTISLSSATTSDQVTAAARSGA